MSRNIDEVLLPLGLNFRDNPGDSKHDVLITMNVYYEALKGSCGLEGVNIEVEFAAASTPPITRTASQAIIT